MTLIASTIKSPLPGRFIRRPEWKYLLFGLICLMLGGVVAIRLASHNLQLQRSCSLGDYTASITGIHGQLQVELFRNIAEDDFYWHAAIAFRAIELTLAAAAVALCWWIYRDSRRRNAPGFAIHPITR